MNPNLITLTLTYLLLLLLTTINVAASQGGNAHIGRFKEPNPAIQTTPPSPEKLLYKPQPTPEIPSRELCKVCADFMDGCVG